MPAAFLLVEVGLPQSFRYRYRSVFHIDLRQHGIAFKNSLAIGLKPSRIEIYKHRVLPK